MFATAKEQITEVTGSKPPYQEEPGKLPAPNPSDSHGMLILIASPLLKRDGHTPVEKIAIQKEVDAIIKTLKSVEPHKSLRVIVEVATRETLWRVLGSKENLPTIVHFIGHGMISNGDVALVLEDKEGIADPLSIEDLEGMLSGKNSQEHCQLVFLSMFNNERLATIFDRIGVSYIISINLKDSILDSPARIFAEKFYRKLFNQEEISNAIIDIMEDLKRNKPEIHKLLKPALSYRRKGEPDGKLVLKNGQIIEPELSKGNLLSRKSDREFVGRNQELHEIAHYLNTENRTCLALHGYGGMGKTSLAIAAGKWHQERKRYEDGVWFIELGGVAKAGTIKTLISEKLGWDLSKAISGKSLLILDDIDDLLGASPREQDELIKLLSDLNAQGYDILITSRERLPRGTNNYKSYDIVGLKEEDALELLKKDLSQECWNDEESEEFKRDLKQVMEYLCGYPLPIILANSYMRNENHSLAQLKEELWEAIRNSVDIEGLIDDENMRYMKDRSLKISLDLSYKVLNNLARMNFMLLSIFPNGIVKRMAEQVLGKQSVDNFEILFRYSLLEIENPYTERRYRLLDPVRDYIREKWSLENLVEKYSFPVILEYYYNNIQALTNSLDTINTEKLNLKFFLTWGSENEKSSDNICRSARIASKLENKIDLLYDGESLQDLLNKCLTLSVNHQDKFAEADIYRDLGRLKLKKFGLDSAKLDIYNALDRYQKCLDSIHEMMTRVQIRMKIGYCREVLEEYEIALKIYEEIQILCRELNNLELIEENQQSIMRAKNKLAFRQFKLIPFEFSLVKLNPQGRETLRTTNESLYLEEHLPNRVNLEMVIVPAGKFMMGKSDGEDGYDSELPRHEVRVESFLMGRYPITQEQWRAIAEMEPIATDLNPDPSRFKGNKKPVESVSWRDALEFCARLSKYTGKNYRLPSEAEWEYGCRAGTTTPYHFGETISTEVANYNGNYSYGRGEKGVYRGETTEVEQFGVVRLKDDPNQLRPETTLIPRIPLHLSSSALTTPFKLVVTP